MAEINFPCIPLGVVNYGELLKLTLEHTPNFVVSLMAYYETKYVTT
jgi:hypothetical protein